MQARRGLGFHAGALSDAKAIIRLADPSDPDLASIRREIKELELLIENRPPDLRYTNITNDEYLPDEEDDFPNEKDIEKSEFNPEADWTESEDDPHDGNGVPCRYHNRRGGCLKGDKCPFSHNVDDPGERDLMCVTRSRLHMTPHLPAHNGEECLQLFATWAMSRYGRNL
jgi:Zinc finger C-x8-C-x5-C-x3-H type (and similar)